VSTEDIGSCCCCCKEEYAASDKHPNNVLDEDDDVEDEDAVVSPEFCSEVLRRKSWVTAMPMEAKEREVRSQARKVRSK